MTLKQYSEEEKQKIILEASKHYYNFMKTLGLDPDTNPHEIDTPKRVAKAFVNDLIKSRYNLPPDITAFENTDKYDGMVFQGCIDVKSICSHHHLVFIGKAYVAYLPDPNGKVIGLSKLNRVVDYFCRKPQVQENLTTQIHDFLNKTCEGNKGIAVVIKASHMCACVRGVQHDSTMCTSKLSGAFQNDSSAREEFYRFISYVN